MKTLAMIVLVGALPFSAQLRAETEGSAAAGGSPLISDILPKPVNPEHFASVLSSSPFQRTLNLSETYTLRGVAKIEGEPVATLYNRDSKKTVVVTAQEANENGMQLVEVVPAQELTGVAAKIAFSGEEFELSFEPERVVPIPKGTSRPGESGKDGKHGDRDRHRGPSKQDIERYKALTDAQREKFRAYIRQTMQKYPNLSREERGNMIRGALSRIADGGEVTLDNNPPPPPSSSRRP